MGGNGRNSCTLNSRHIPIRYSPVKDRVKKDEFSIEYCPTQPILAYFFTNREYIPKIFAFKNPYPLNPEESDLFYFLLIRTK